jgi:hypothetical protein
VVAALRRRQEADRFLAVLFLFVFTSVTLVDGARLLDPYWWASLSFVPALLLLGRTGALLIERVRAGSQLLAAALLALALYDVSWLGRAGTRAPRLTRQEWAARIAADGEQRLARGDAETARDQAQQALLLDAGNASARALLARLP